MAAEEEVREASPLLNQAIGLLVFAAGIVLLVFVFAWTYRLYNQLDGELLGVQAAPTQASITGLAQPAKLPAGAVSGKLAKATKNAAARPLTSVLVAFGLKLLVLFVLGWLAGLIASQGIGLAVGAARLRRRREG